MTKGTKSRKKEILLKTLRSQIRSFPRDSSLAGFIVLRKHEEDHRCVMNALRKKTHQIIFEADTPAGKAFDVGILWAIGLSVFIICLESVESIRTQFGRELLIAEWFFTILFTLEYALRIYVVPKPRHYIFSFFGVVDLLAILPSYIGLFILADTRHLMVIRALRFMRVFRVLKLARFLGEAGQLRAALIASRHKIAVFVGAVLTFALIFGALMYIIEGPSSGFTSIPRGVYWAIVTVTTVGYGDISPSTPLGQALSSFLMICGYGIIAVPTGLVSAHFSRPKVTEISTRRCSDCNSEGHDSDACFCKYCGTEILNLAEA